MAKISSHILARYAADAALEIDGVAQLAGTPLHLHKPVRVSEEEGVTRIELRLVMDWGASIPDVAVAVQQRVGEYLEQMARVRPGWVDVVVEAIATHEPGPN